MTVNKKSSKADAAEIRGLRQEAGVKTVSEFAIKLKAARSLVSQLESGKRKPSREMYLALSGFAADRGLYAKALLFLQKANVNRRLLSAARRALDSPSGEIVKLPVMRKTSTGFEETGHCVSLPETLVTNSTVCITLDKNRDRFAFAAGEIAVLEESVPDLWELRGKAVLLEFIPPSGPEPSDKYEITARRWEKEIAGLFLGEITIRPGRKLMTGAGDWEIEFGPLTKESALSPPSVIGFGRGQVDAESIETAESVEDFKQLNKKASKAGKADIALGDRVHLLGRVVAILPRYIAVPADRQPEQKKKK